MEHVRKSGEYGFLTREGLRQILVDGGAVTVPDGVKYIGIGLTAGALAVAELLDNAEWCEFQRIKRDIYNETEP